MQAEQENFDAVAEQVSNSHRQCSARASESGDSTTMYFMDGKATVAWIVTAERASQGSGHGVLLHGLLAPAAPQIRNLAVLWLDLVRPVTSRPHMNTESPWEQANQLSIR